MNFELNEFMRLYTTLFFFLIFPQIISAQIGGDNVYEFINLPISARVSALGGNLITVKDDDNALAYGNPAALNPLMHKQVTFNSAFYAAEINYGFLGYGFHLDKLETTFNAGLQYITYGDFTAADETGLQTGEFGAAEYVFNVGAGRPYSEQISYGINLKTIYSRLESYNSLGVAADAAVMYADTAANFTATMVFKNFGTQLSTYVDDNREDMPFEVQAGVSKRLRYLPLRFSVIAHNLQRWNIRYDDPNQVEPTSLFDDTPQDANRFVVWTDNFFRHFIFNGELLAGKADNFRIRFGYNHLRRAELNVNKLRSLAGFSAGLGIKVKKFRIDYGLAVYHLAGTVHQFGISTDIGAFRK